MKKLFKLSVFVFLAAVILIQAGCGDSDDPVEPGPEDCSININFPAAGSSYQSGDQLRIRWDETGSASEVEINLLKGGSLVALIDTVANVESRLWNVDPMGSPSGDDFAIQITAVDEIGCTDTSDEFTIINTTGCALAFTMADTAFLDAGMEYEITWDSSSTTGFLDIELLRADLGDDRPVGYIVSNIQDSGSYLWTVDSLHEGTYGFFFLRISDGNVEGCMTTSETFAINDADICEIWINAPQPGAVWVVGETQEIAFTAVDPTTTHVDISLYEGIQFVNHIEPNVPVTETGVQQVVQWMVSTIGSTSPGTTYKIKVSDSSDGYCVGWSEPFTILEN